MILILKNLVIQKLLKMKKTNISIICILFILFLYSCGSFSDGVKVLKNEKIRTTDEFLVKKREPLAEQE